MEAVVAGAVQLQARVDDCEIDLERGELSGPGPPVVWLFKMKSRCGGARSRERSEWPACVAPAGFTH